MPDQTGELAELRSRVAAYERGEAIAEYSPDGRTLRANEAYAALVGRPPATIAGTEHRALVHPGSAECTDLWEQLRAGTGRTGEYRLLWQGASPRWIRSRWMPVTDEDGRVVTVVEHAVDVTADKRATADAQGKIQAISRSQAVIEFDLEGHIMDANENFLGLVGYSRDEVIGRHHSMFVSAENAQSPAYREFWRRLAAGEFVSGEFRRIGRDGREVWLQAVYNPVMGLDGQPWKVVKFAVDVTPAKLANAAFEGKVVAIDRSQAVIEFDLGGHVLSANENFLAAVGYRADEVIGRHHRMFVSPETAESEEYADFWRHLRRGEFASGEFHRYGKDGRDVWLQATYNPIFGLDGQPWKVVKFATDVTAEKCRNVELAGRLAAIDRSQAVIEFDLDGRILAANENDQQPPSADAPNGGGVKPPNSRSSSSANRIGV